MAIGDNNRADVVADLLLRYRRDPSRYEVEVLFGDRSALNSETIVKLALGRAVAFAEPGRESSAARKELQQAAIHYVRQVFFRAGATPFENLGLAPGATQDEIRNAYRLLMQLVHPDRQESGEKWPESYAAQANKAYAELSDARTRLDLERELTAAKQHGVPGVEPSGPTVSSHPVPQAVRRPPVKATVPEQVLPEFLTWRVGSAVREYPKITLILVVALFAALAVRFMAGGADDGQLAREKPGDRAKTADAKPAPIETKPGSIEAKPGSIEAKPAVVAVATTTDAKKAAEEAKKAAAAETKAAEEARKAAVAEAKAAEDAKKVAEDAKKAAEEARKLAEAEKKAAEEAKKAAIAEAKAAEEAKRVAEAEKKAAEEAKQAALAQAKAIEEAKKVAQAKAAEEAKKAAEEAKKVAQAKAAEEAKRIAEAKAAEEAKKVAQAKAAEEAKKAAEEAKRVAEAEKKAAEEAKKVAQAKAAEEAKKAAEEAKRVAAEKKAAEEAKKVAEKKAAEDAKKAAAAQKAPQVVAVAAPAPAPAPVAPPAPPVVAPAPAPVAAAAVPAPAPAAPPAPAPAPPPPGPPPIADTDVEVLLASFVQNYEAGRLDAFTALFASDASVGGKRGTAAIRSEYDDLFKTTTTRKLRLSRANWTLNGDRATARGEIAVKIVFRDGREADQRLLLNMDIQRRDGRVVIGRLMHQVID